MVSRNIQRNMANPSQCYNADISLSGTQECTIIASNAPVLVPGTREITLLADLDLVDQKDNTTLFSFPLSYSTQLCGFLLLTHVPNW